MTAGLFLGALALVLVGFLRPRAASGEPPAQSAPAPAGWTALFCALAAVLFLAQLRAVELAAATQVPFPAGYTGLPVVPIDESAPLYSHTAPWVANTMLALSAAETAVLFALYRVLRGRRPTRATVAALGLACAVMLAAALRSPATTSQDLYLYVGFAHLGQAAYAPPATAFAGEFRAVNRLWGLPMLPAAYGPLWIALSRLSLLCGGSLGAQVEAFRIAGAFFFCAGAALLFRARRDFAATALFALNPALLQQYVADGHNDIFALALVLGAFVAVRRSTLAAIVLVAAAGAAKLPFALPGALAFAQFQTPRRRLVPAAIALLLALTATELFSGGRYAASAHAAVLRYALGDAFTAEIHFAIAAVALFALGAALLWRRFNRGASWSFLALSTELFPWYVGWGIPYALLEGSWLGVYLLSLPLVAFNLTTVYAPTLWTRAAYGILLIAPLLPLLARREAQVGPRRTPGL